MSFLCAVTSATAGQRSVYGSAAGNCWNALRRLWERGIVAFATVQRSGDDNGSVMTWQAGQSQWAAQRST